MSKTTGTRARDSRAGTATNLTRWITCSVRSAAVLSSLPFAAFAAGPGGAGAALPTGGTVATGTAVISSPAAGALTVQQSSSRAILNWSSFSIGQGDKVTFDNGTGATLNRVSAGAPISDLNGILSATGSVYLINPSGVIVGKSGVINVGGTFVASTQDITDGGFMAGGSLNFSGTSNGAVMNYGRIGALGGDVVLIASKVANQGTIDASKGAVGLLAGYQVLLKDQADSDGHFSVTMGGTGTSATNAGAISAAAVELRAEQGNIYALAGNTSGVIRATEVSGSGGDIRLLAPGGSVEVASGAVLDASAGASGNGGHIQVDSADTTFAGTALARGGATGGDGGLIETSGTQVNFTGAHIDTTAAAGKTGEWLVDPTDLTIDTSNNTTLSADLATTSVVLFTTATGASGIGTQTTTANTKGDVNVDAPVSWSSINTLGLEAYHSVYINAPVTISGVGTRAGVLILATNANAAATDGDLFFGGGGNVQFTGATNGLAGHLSLNGKDFALETSVPNLISAINANPAGNYALATSVTASGTLNGNQIAAQGSFNGLLSNPLVGTPFTGTLEGLGNTITNLTIHDNTGVGNGGTPQIFVGLIGYLAAPGVVRDIGLVSADVTSTSDASSTGALVGYSTGTIVNSWSSGTVQGQGAVGGVLGTNGGGGLVSGSHSSAAVSSNGNTLGGDEMIGGLVGANGDSLSTIATITNSYATGTVSDNGATSTFIGGLVGWNGPFGDLGTISQSYATGAVTQTGPNGEAGGLAAVNGDIIQNSYAQGPVHDTNASSIAGGLLGENDLTVTNSYSTGAVTGSAQLGGAIGLDSGILNGGSVQNIYFDSTVNSTLGGIGSNDGATVTGLSTPSLQNGLLPSGFGAAWGAASGFYPFLNFQYPHGAAEISGTVFNGYDTSPVGAGLLVALSTYGTIGGTAQTNASGAYALLADGDQQSEVLLSGDAIHANTYVGTPTTATTANLYAGYLRLPSASSSLSSTLAGVALAAGSESSRDLLYTAAGGLTANTSVDILTPGAFAIDTALNAGTGTISINAGGAVTQTTALTAASLDLLGAGASYSLTNTSNNIGTVAANTGAITLADSAALSVGAVNATTGVTSTGAVTLSGTGNLSLISGGVTGGANSGVSLAATASFINDVGSNAVQVSGTGRWLIYSGGGNTFGNLNSNDTAVWNTAPLGAVTASGNRYVFTFQPTLTFTSTNDSKTYGSDASSQIQADFTVSGLHAGVANAYLGDTAAAVYSGAPTASSAGAAANASVAGGPYAITLGTGTLVSLDGYALAISNVTPGRLTINPLTVSASLTGPISKVYDGTTAASLAGGGYILNGIVPADAADLGLTSSSGAYGGKDVGTNLSVSFSGLALSGSAASNYNLETSGFGGNVGVITPLAISASLTGPVSKTYDGTTNASLAGGGYTLNGIIPADAANVGLTASSGAYAGKDVGTNLPVNFSGLALSGAAALDYTLSTVAFAGNVGQITPLAIGATLLGPVSKTYDGTTTATLAGGNYTLDGIVPADAANLGLTASSGAYAGKDVGTNLPVIFSGLALSGAAASDYTLSIAGFAGNVGQITPLAIGATLLGPVSKTYDGTTNASLVSGGYTLDGIVPADAANLGLTASSGAYAGKDVGTNLPVIFSGLALSGAAASDYSLSIAGFAGNVGQINPLAISASLTGPVSKTYDGTTNASLVSGGYTLNGIISADATNIGLTASSGAYAGKDVGTNLPVNFSGLALSGSAALDYTLSTVAFAGNVGQITPLAIGATLLGPVSKTYDGTTNASLVSGAYTLNGIIPADATNLGLTASSGAYTGKDVGTNLPVNFTGLTLTGAAALDYTLSTVAFAGNVGQINPLAISATLTGPVSKTYDGTTNASLVGGGYTLNGIIPADATNTGLTASSGAYAGKDVGTNLPVNFSGLTLTGADASDYSLPSTSLAGNVGTITPLALTASLTGTVSKTYDGTTFAALTGANYALSAPIGTDVVNLVPVTSGTYDTKDAGTGKSVSVSGLTLTGADANDYSLSSTSLVGNVGTITPLALTASLTGTVSKTYDGTTVAALTGANYALSAPIGADVVSLVSVTSGTYDSKDVGTGKSVSVSGLTLTGADAEDYSVAGSLAGNIGSITAKPLTAVVGANNKIYDATTADTGSAQLSAGVISGDQVSLSSGSYTFSDPNAGQNKTVSVTGIALVGADSQNYSLSIPADATAAITPRPITIAADNASKLVGQADPPLAFSITSGSLAGGTQVSGALTRAPGDSLGSYDITQGSLSLSSNYALSFVDGVFTIAPATPSLVAFAPANGLASNAFNGPAAFTFSGTGLGVSQAVAPSTDTAGASLSLLPTSQGDDNSDAPYPDNRRISDNIRFSAAVKP